MLRVYRMTLAQLPGLVAEIKAAIAGFPALAQENADLKTKLAAAEADSVQAKAKVDELTKALADKDSAVASAASDKAKAEQEKADALKAKADAEAAAVQAKTEADAKVKDMIDNPSKVAAEIAAKAGVKIGERPPAAGSDPKKLTGLAAVRAAIEAEIATAKR